jgi:hypothetical protein
MSSHTPMTTWQRDALASIREHQEAYLSAIATWRAAFGGATTVGAAPTPPLAPPADPGLTSKAALEANRAFTEAVVKQQQDFLEKLTLTLSSDG